MPVSKSRRKGKSRAKAKDSSANGTSITTKSGSETARALTQTSTAPIDDPWFTVVILLSLITGSITAGGMKPPDFLNFSMILGTLMASRYLGGLVTLNKTPLSLRSVSTSIEQLKRGSRKSHVDTVHEGHGPLIELCLISLLLAAILSLFLSITENPYTASLLVGSAASFVYLRARLPANTLSVVVSACVTLLLPCMLSILGVFTQSGQLRCQAAVLGLVTGSMLGAATVARFAQVLEDRGWKRSKLVTQKNGKEVRRPCGVARLYAGFLFSGFVIVFITASMGALPRSLMIVVLTMAFAPNVASAFLDRTKNDRAIFHSTVRIAVLSGVLTLVGGVLSGL